MSYPKPNSSVDQNIILSHSFFNAYRYVSFCKATLYPDYFQMEFSLCLVSTPFSPLNTFFLVWCIFRLFFSSNSSYLSLIAIISVGYELWI